MKSEIIELNKKVQFLIDEINTLKDRVEDIKPLMQWLKEHESDD